MSWNWHSRRRRKHVSWKCEEVAPGMSFAFSIDNPELWLDAINLQQMLLTYINHLLITSSSWSRSCSSLGHSVDILSANSSDVFWSKCEMRRDGGRSAIIRS